MVARAVRHLAGADATADLSSLESDISMLMVESAGGFDPAVIPEVLAGDVTPRAEAARPP